MAQVFEIVIGQKFVYRACNKWRGPIGAVVLLGAALGAEQDLSPVSLLSKITLLNVHGRIDHLAADVHNARLFVAAAGNDSVEVVDVRTESLLASIHEVTEPHNVAYLKSSNRILVTNGGDGSIRFFDGSTLKLLSSLHLGMDPGTIRVDPVHNRVYVGYGDGAIAVLDSEGKRVGDIALKAHPESFQLAQNQPRLFVNLPDRHAVAVLDTTTLKVLSEWPIQEAQDNHPMAIDEEKRRVFIACRQPSRLLVLDMDSGMVVARLPTVGAADDLFYDPIRARIYVLGGRGQLAIYSQQTADQYTQLDSVGTTAGTRTGLFVTEWNRFFVAVRDFGPHPAEIRIYQPH